MNSEFMLMTEASSIALIMSFLSPCDQVWMRPRFFLLPVVSAIQACIASPRRTDGGGACIAADQRIDGARVVDLLREVLHGTNTAERQIAARRILRHLLGQYTIGAVTTHDLTLADASDLKKSSVMVHFRESLDEPEGGRPIAFDYRLRAGIATSTNALKLMEIMGLSRAEELSDD